MYFILSGDDFHKKQHKKMFGFFSKKDKTTELLRGNDPQAENIFIHTMDRDLREDVAPEKEIADEKEEANREISRPVSRININNLTDQQKSSPFLNKNTMPGPFQSPADKPTTETGQKSPINIHSTAFRITPQDFSNSESVLPASEPKTQASSSKTIPVPLPPKNVFGTKNQKPVTDGVESPDKKTFKKLVLILSVILIAMLISAGTYYFWSTRKNTGISAEPPVEKTSENPPAEEIPPVEEPGPSKFSTAGLNYLEIDVNDPSPEAAKEALKSYAQEVKASGITSALEFKAVTLEKSPISLATFLTKMKLTLSPELISSLEDNFSLYIYNDQGNPGIGLTIPVKKTVTLDDVMLREEKNLPIELQSLFPVEQYTLEKNRSFSTSEFDSSLWGKLGIRYLNIVSPENLSIDYILLNENGATKLLIGTTKMTLRSIIESQRPSLSGQK